MTLLVDFLSLRPIWTRRGLEVIWYAYLAATLLHLAHGFSFLFDRSSSTNVAFGFSFFYSTLFALLNLAFVRIFLELALKYLLSNSEGPAPPRLASQR
jgi:hypothetical protein